MPASSGPAPMSLRAGGGRWLLCGAALFACAAASPASADDGSALRRQLPQSRQQVVLSFAPLVERVAPAVVNIYARRMVRRRPVSPLFDDPFFRRFFGERFSLGGPREREQNSLGSGVIVAPDGLVVTNHHVIEKADRITVVLADRREFDARIVSADERTDLAILRIAAPDEDLPHLGLRDSDDLQVGDLVLAIGNPFGVGQTVTGGIVSALARTAAGVSDFGFFIQTDAAINPGNSGGALVTMDGRLVGINTAIYSRTGGSIGIGFAIPSNMVATVVDAAERGGPVVRPWIGAMVQAMSSDIARSLDLDRPVGVIVAELHPAGPARAAGLRAGDVILAVDGRHVADPAAFAFRIAMRRIGGRAAFRIRRDGALRDVEVALIAPPETPPRELTRLSGRHPLDGAAVANLSPALAAELSLEGMPHGVIVTGLRSGGVAERLGFQPGDVVLRVNEHEVKLVRDLQDALARTVDRWRIAFRRDGKTLSFVIGA